MGMHLQGEVSFPPIYQANSEQVSETRVFEFILASSVKVIFL